MYYNTNNETGKQLQDSQAKAKSQDQSVLEFIQSHEQLGVTPERTLRHFKIMEPLTESRWHNTPITSIRRSFSNLAKRGLIVKTGDTVTGDFGKQINLWKKAL